jgi:signal transduction histidine kinase
MLLEVQFDQNAIAQLFDLQPDAVTWYTPVFAEDEIVDFEFRYCNTAASRLFGVPVNHVMGSTVKESTFLDDVTRNYIFEQCCAVWSDGKPVEFTYYSPIFSSYLNVQRSKALNGILSITRDRTLQVRAEQERERQRNLLISVANASPTCIVLCEAIRDPQQHIVDFRLLMVNDKIAHDLQIPKKQIETMTYCQLHPSVRTNGLLDILSNVVQTGEPFKEEVFFEIFGGWFLLTVNKIEEDRVLAIYLNINETKKDKLALQDQAEWFNNILSHSPSGIIAFESIRDRSGEIIDFQIRLANQSGKMIVDLPPNPIGKRLLEIYPEMRHNGFFQHHKDVVESGVPFKSELLLNGSRWVQMSLAKLNDGLITNFMDITELKQYEETIEERTHELQSILNASLNGVFACESVRDKENRIVNFRFVKINAAFTNILKLKEEDVLGKLYTEVFPAVANTDLVQKHIEVIETGKSMQTEHYYRDGAIEGWFLISISKWGDNGFVQTFYDYSRLKRLQQQLELTIQGLKRSNERLTEFSHVASHDLNEPLRKVITFSKLLTDKYGAVMEAGAKDYLDRIEKTAMRMQVLLENLLIYSRVTKQINSFEQVNLNSVVQEVQSDLETYITAKNAIINVDMLPTITGERTQLRQLFQNLISNALKFQPADRQPVVAIRLADAEHRRPEGETYFMVEVSDNGIGFDPSESEKIFQLFHRLHARHEYEGTGIGLAIVQRAMENHHGFAEAVSEPGQGATFKLYFPR